VEKEEVNFVANRFLLRVVYIATVVKAMVAIATVVKEEKEGEVRVRWY